MNLPNRLTVLRVLLIPVFLWLLLSNTVSAQISQIFAPLIFVVASLTDWLDGYIARKYNLVTNFGKLMDPLADKLLVASALIAFVQLGSLQAWVVIILIGREFIITGFRMLALEKKIVISAGFWGKLKTVTQMALIISILLQPVVKFLSIINPVLIFLSVLFCIISAIEYIYVNRSILKEKS